MTDQDRKIIGWVLKLMVEALIILLIRSNQGFDSTAQNMHNDWVDFAKRHPRFWNEEDFERF